jgi:hypothetical protein
MVANARRLPSLALLLCAPGLLAGCGPLLSAATADLAGIASAAVTGAVTENAAAATGIGLGVSAGARAGLQYAQRRVHRAEQDRIAEAAGALGPGEVGRWAVDHPVPLETTGGRGRVAVTRTIALGPDLACKEIVFSVDRAAAGGRAPRESFYTATVCRDGEVWRWASAEPATGRWGSLQ